MRSVLQYLPFKGNVWYCKSINSVRLPLRIVTLHFNKRFKQRYHKTMNKLFIWSYPQHLVLKPLRKCVVIHRESEWRATFYFSELCVHTYVREGKHTHVTRSGVGAALSGSVSPFPQSPSATLSPQPPSAEAPPAGARLLAGARWLAR